MIMIILLKPLLLQILLLYNIIIIELFHILHSICLQLTLNYIILYCLTIQTLLSVPATFHFFFLTFVQLIFNLPFATF